MTDMTKSGASNRSPFGRPGGTSGFTLLEVIVTFLLVIVGLALIVPSGRTSQDSATTKTVAEDLVARMRLARQAAVTRSVPVAVVFPADENTQQTEEAYFLEGEINPKVTERWRIPQTRTETVYYTGRWAGPEWRPATPLRSPSIRFDLDGWFADIERPDANMIVFTPSGTVVSNMQAADGRFRVLVAMGLSGADGSVSSANVPHTVWVSATGESGLEAGIHAADIPASHLRDSGPVAVMKEGTTRENRPPVVQIIAPGTRPGPKALPDNVNPKTNNGNVLNLDSVLTLEVRVRDPDGDAPYFRWETAEVGRLRADGTSFQRESDLALWGGRFSNAGEMRMEWDPETNEWVGRDTWSPAPGDTGGNRYRLVCKITDRRGGVATTGFPVDGNYLVTSKEPWILYKTWNPQGRSEFWKMTLDGLEHSKVLGFTYQGVHSGQWTPSGAEVIVGAPDGIYRVSADGGNLKRLTPNNIGVIDGCCLSPQGDAVYYIGGAAGSKRVRKVYFNEATGVQVDSALTPSNNDSSSYRRVNGINDLSAAEFGSPPNEKVILLSSYYHDNRDGGLWGTGLFRKRRRYSGGMAVDTQDGSPTNYRSPASWNGVGQHRNTPYGISMTHTNDPLGTGVHVLYGSAGGQIHGHRVNYNGGPVSSNFVRGAALPGFPKSTGRGDVHHPKYATVERDSLVFAAGRGQNSRIYYMPNANSPGQHRELPLHPLNRGADLPSVSRAR